MELEILHKAQSNKGNFVTLMRSLTKVKLLHSPVRVLTHAVDNPHCEIGFHLSKLHGEVEQLSALLQVSRCVPWVVGCVEAWSRGYTFIKALQTCPTERGQHTSCFQQADSKGRTQMLVFTLPGWHPHFKGCMRG